MRLVGATLVRDAADVIEAFVRHNLTVLDGLAIVDHGSCDGTSDVLTALAAEGLPVFVARDETPAFDQYRLINRLVRHVFATSDADWVFPIDSDEFLKVGSRPRLEAILKQVPAGSHLALSWLTYVPHFGVGDDDIVAILRSARRVVQQRHGLSKVAVARHFLTTGERIGKGNHIIEWHVASGAAVPSAICAPADGSIAHVPIRSELQFIAKFVNGWLSTLASRRPTGEESFHWREAYAHIRTGRPLTAAQLSAFAMNYGIPRARWLPVEDIEIVEDPFLAEITLRHGPHRPRDPLTLVLTLAERLLDSRGASQHDD